MIELSAFLKEIACPYQDFVTGPVSSRLQTKESRILLLDYLLTELMASKICKSATPDIDADAYVISVVSLILFFPYILLKLVGLKILN